MLDVKEWKSLMKKSKKLLKEQIKNSSASLALLKETEELVIYLTEDGEAKSEVCIKFDPPIECYLARGITLISLKKDTKIDFENIDSLIEQWIKNTLNNLC